jgi:hypothetical protein
VTNTHDLFLVSIPSIILSIHEGTVEEAVNDRSHLARVDHGRQRRRLRRRLGTTIVPSIIAAVVPRLRGGDILWRRATASTEVDFVAVVIFDDWSAAESSAGPGGTISVVPPAAQQLLSRQDQHSQHDDTVARHSSGF